MSNPCPAKKTRWAAQLGSLAVCTQPVTQLDQWPDAREARAACLLRRNTQLSSYFIIIPVRVVGVDLTFAWDCNPLKKSLKVHS